MFRGGRALLLVAATVLCCGMLSSVGTAADKDELTGVVVGRTGEVLHISVPQPVEEGALFAVKLLEREKPIAEARVLSCTRERPFIALAKVVRGDIEQPVPTGVRAYADVGSVEGPAAPKPMGGGKAGGEDRFSLQAGAFYPHSPVLRDTVADYWQAYRLNYSLLKVGNFETMFSAEYSKGAGDASADGVKVERTMEIVPLTLLAKFRPFRLGSSHLFVGAGAGSYRIRSEEKTGAGVVSSSTNKTGYELAAGLESRRGWVMELRYRDVQDTDISGFSLTMGARF